LRGEVVGVVEDHVGGDRHLGGLLGGELVLGVDDEDAGGLRVAHAVADGAGLLDQHDVPGEAPALLAPAVIAGVEVVAQREARAGR
jgi:hypothetical protein